MKKRFFHALTLALVAAMTLSLTACGGGAPIGGVDIPSSGATPDNNTPAGTPAPTPENTPQEDNKPPSDLEEAPISDFKYRYDAETQGVMIEQYTGESTLKVRVPQKIEGEPVTGIGQVAFQRCGFKEIYLPDSLKAIGYRAFDGCTGLTSITIPDSMTTIGNGSFSGCTGLTSITIPNSVTEIGGMAFMGCTGLTRITIPNSVTEIGSYAFWGCTGLIDITIPDGVTVIGDNAFDGCTRLTSITIPDSVTKIDMGTFYGCTGLTNIIIPDSVTVIGFGAFDGCTEIVVTYKGNSYRYDELYSLEKAINGE